MIAYYIKYIITEDYNYSDIIEHYLAGNHKGYMTYHPEKDGEHAWSTRLFADTVFSYSQDSYCVIYIVFTTHDLY